MFKFIFRSILFISLFFIHTAYTASQQILHYRSNIQINTDNSAHIIETISTYIEPQNLLQDMGRSLPLQLYTSKGEKKDVSYDVNEIDLNGQPITFELQKENNQLKIIFDNEAVFEPGIYVYTLNYTVKNIIKNSNSEEFIWNVTGNNWNIPILKTEADVTLPNQTKISNYKAYVIAEDFKTLPALARQLNKNQLNFTSNHALQPGESFVIATNWGGNLINSNIQQSNVTVFRSIAKYIVPVFALFGIIVFLFQYQQPITPLRQHAFYINLGLTFIAMSVAMSVAIQKLTMFYFFLWIILWTLICYYLIVRVMKEMQIVKQNPTSANLFGLLFSSAFTVPFLIAELIGIYVFSFFIPLIILIPLFVLVIINFLSFHFAQT